MFYNSNEKYKDLSKKYNISIGNICVIKNGKSWTHITKTKKQNGSK